MYQKIIIRLVVYVTFVLDTITSTASALLMAGDGRFYAGFFIAIGLIAIVVVAFTVWDDPREDTAPGPNDGVSFTMLPSSEAFATSASTSGFATQAASISGPHGQTAHDSLTELSMFIQDIRICKTLTFADEHDHSSWEEPLESDCLTVFKHGTGHADTSHWTEATAAAHLSADAVDLTDKEVVTERFGISKVIPTLGDTYTFGIVRFASWVRIKARVQLRPFLGGTIYTHPGVRGQLIANQHRPIHASKATTNFTWAPEEPMFVRVSDTQSGVWFRFQCLLSPSAADLVPIAGNQTRLRVLLAYDTDAMVRASLGVVDWDLLRPHAVDKHNNTLRVDLLDVVPVVYYVNETVIKETYLIFHDESHNQFTIRWDVYYTTPDVNKVVRGAQIRLILQGATDPAHSWLPPIAYIVPLSETPFAYDFATNGTIASRVIQNFKLLSNVLDTDSCLLSINGTEAVGASYSLHSRFEVSL